MKKIQENILEEPRTGKFKLAQVAERLEKTFKTINKHKEFNSIITKLKKKTV